MDKSTKFTNIFECSNCNEIEPSLPEPFLKIAPRVPQSDHRDVPEGCRAIDGRNMIRFEEEPTARQAHGGIWQKGRPLRVTMISLLGQWERHVSSSHEIE